MRCASVNSSQVLSSVLRSVRYVVTMLSLLALPPGAPCQSATADSQETTRSLSEKIQELEMRLHALETRQTPPQDGSRAETAETKNSPQRAPEADSASPAHAPAAPPQVHDHIMEIPGGRNCISTDTQMWIMWAPRKRG